MPRTPRPWGAALFTFLALAGSARCEPVLRGQARTGQSSLSPAVIALTGTPLPLGGGFEAAVPDLAPVLSGWLAPLPTPAVDGEPAAAVPETTTLGVGLKAQKDLADPAAGPAEAVLDSLYQAGGQPAAAVLAPAPASETDGLEGRALFNKLHEITGRSLHPQSYDAARAYMFSTADNVTVGGERGIIEAYSQVFVPGRSDRGGGYPERGDQNHDGWVDAAGMNAEHVWPQSFFAKRLPMRSDLHHLLPTFMKPNELRGHLPFGEVKGQGDYRNDAGAKRGQGVFEPPDAAKGRVARALLYFYVRHFDRNITGGEFDDNFWNDKLEMILRWNRTHPPDANERARNGLVESFQGNRNPFVDDPALADRIGIPALRRLGRWGLGYGYRFRYRR